MQELDELYGGGKKSRVVRRKSRVGKKKSRVVKRKTRVGKKKSRVVKRKTCGGGMQHLTPADYTNTPVEGEAQNVTEGNEDLLDSVAQ